MAARFVRRVRPLLLIAALGASAAFAIPTIASAAPSPHQVRSPKPVNINTVQQQLAHLTVQSSQLVEQYDQARIQVTQRTRQAAAARKAATLAATTYDSANAAFTQVVQAQYESGGFGGSSGALLTSSNTSSYLNAISTMDLVSNHEAQVVKAVQTTHQAAEQASRQANNLLAAAQAESARLAAKKSQVTSQIATYQALLSKLNAKQRQMYSRAVNPSVSATNFKPTAPSAAAQRALDFAIAQIGKPYVFGSAGPGSYDCSGLTMRAWAQGGISLPHSAAEQYNYGTHVSRSQLEPGDLLFFYQPIGHVTIYAGDGMMVSAPETGEDVSLVPLDDFNSDYVGATHLG